MRRLAVTSALLAIVLGLASAAPAAVDLDDPDLFGPGEAWSRPGSLARGDSGPWVVRLQEGLAGAGFRPGPVDGIFGRATRAAVYAFQKVNDLERDGTFEDDDWDVLAGSGWITLPEVADEPDRVEVDLEAQVLYLVLAHRVEAVVPISSGNGELFRARGGRLVPARTPEGSFRFYRHVEGWRISYLGGLYQPFYFRGGYAIHGSTSVPPFPASHGCVRVELGDMDYLTGRLQIGMPIHVYGNQLARADLFDA